MTNKKEFLFKTVALKSNVVSPSFSRFCTQLLLVINKTLKDINLEAKNLTKNLKIHDRIKQLPLKNAYITVKDHKENFLTHPKCRLINPTKSDVGRIVKVRIDCINKAVRLKSKLMQWTDQNKS